MSLTPDQLPDDIAELKRRLIVQSAELTAAKNGLLITTLEVEKLKAQIGRLKRQAFGTASERIAREIEQLELRLEEAEAVQAEAAAAMPVATDDMPPQIP
jgi:transposase